MTREEAKRYWTAKYEAASKWDDPHWEASERKDHRRYVDALKAVIEALSAETISFDFSKLSSGQLYDIRKHRANALAAKWIPCSERLPSESGNYLITVADLRLGHIEEHTVTMADFYVKEKKWNSIVDVYAWMPLPKPYREEREDYELATEQMEHDVMYEPTYNSEDGSM